MPAVLDEILRKARTGAKMLALFDLDSTLFDLSGRTGKICEAFAADAAMAARFPAATSKIREIEFRRGDFGLHAPMHRLGFGQESQVFEALHQFWHPRFFSSEYLIHDRPLEGAAEFVTELAQAGAVIRYLSGRHVSGMFSGTVESLRRHRFPLSEQHVEICLKPEFGMNDADFKVQVIEDLARYYTNVWLFENEPVNINRILKHHTHVQIVFLDTCHCGVETISAGIPVIENFKLKL